MPYDKYHPPADYILNYLEDRAKKNSTDRQVYIGAISRLINTTLENKYPDIVEILREYKEVEYKEDELKQFSSKIENWTSNIRMLNNFGRLMEDYYKKYPELKKLLSNEIKTQIVEKNKETSALNDQLYKLIRSIHDKLHGKSGNPFAAMEESVRLFNAELNKK